MSRKNLDIFSSCGTKSPFNLTEIGAISCRWHGTGVQLLPLSGDGNGVQLLPLSGDL